MQVCVLGSLLIRDGPTEVAAGGPVQRRILARLAMDAGKPVDPTELEVAAWGEDPPPAARHTIASHIFRLRRLGLAIETTDDRYVLQSVTDVGEVERLSNEGRRAADGRNPQGSSDGLPGGPGLRSWATAGRPRGSA